MKIDVDVLDEDMCPNCPYLKIEERYKLKWEDQNYIYYECGHLGMCQELKGMFMKATDEVEDGGC